MIHLRINEIYLLVLDPLVAAVAAFVLPSNRWRPWLVPIGALGHLVLVAAAVFQWPFVFQSSEASDASVLGGWLLLDVLGKVVLGFISVLFFVCSLYLPGYLAVRSERPNRVFCANLLVVLAMMTLVTPPARRAPTSPGASP